MRFKYGKLHGWSAVLAVVITLLVIAAQQAGWLGHAKQAAIQNQPGLYKVTRFVDGDTIEIDMNGHKERIRMVGVDTPETHKPNTPVQCYGPAAAAYTKNLIGDKPVKLGSDSLSTNRDRYDRLLRYVYLPDGQMVNKLLIQNGYGFYYPYFPFTKSKEFEAAQNSAMTTNRGLWGNCHPTRTDGGGYIANDAL